MIIEVKSKSDKEKYLNLECIQVDRNLPVSECESDKVFQVKYLTFLLFGSLIATVLACYSPDRGEPTRLRLLVIKYLFVISYLLSGLI